jgi:oligoendopeptidase F
VYDTLLATTADNLPRTLHRYVALRKKVLGLDSIHYYDLYNPLFPDVEKQYPYEEALKLTEVAMKPMGPDYVTIMVGGMKPGSGWTDVYPSKGKQSGAYCNAAYGTHPFVLLNYANDLDDVFTTAHEYGHAMHFYLSQQAQPFPTADAPIFLAEIASTFQEEMLLTHLLSKATTKAEKLSLLNKRVENIRLTITRQTLFAEFEKRIHGEIESGGALTAERLSAIYRDLIVKYFGPGFTLDQNDPMEWAYIPHFYYNFYVYKYSTGLMSAIVFTQKVLEAKRGAVEQYKGLLAAGGSDYPLAILEKAGIDFTKKDITQATYDLFARTLDEIESLL